METLIQPYIEYGVSTRAMPGECQSGDCYLVVQHNTGVLMAVADGLGHGAEAAWAVKIAVETLKAHPDEDPAILVTRCHEKMLGTRGAALSLASLDAGAKELRWLGVGNVEAVLLGSKPYGNRRKEILLLRGGVVGDRLPPLEVRKVPVKHGDMLVLATDGINSVFHEQFTSASREESPQQIADHIFKKWAVSTDDALVLVVRFL